MEKCESCSFSFPYCLLCQQQDTSVKKLEMKVAGFIDISGMVSTVGVLVLLMGQPTRNVYFVPLAIFISLSLILQCVLAVVLIIRVSMNSLKDRPFGLSQKWQTR